MYSSSLNLARLQPVLSTVWPPTLTSGSNFFVLFLVFGFLSERQKGRESSEELKTAPKKMQSRPLTKPTATLRYIKPSALKLFSLTLITPSEALTYGLATSKLLRGHDQRKTTSPYLHLFGLFLEGLLVDLQLLGHLRSRLSGQDVLQLQVELLLLLNQQLLLHHLLCLLDQALLQRVDLLDHLVCWRVTALWEGWRRMEKISVSFALDWFFL